MKRRSVLAGASALTLSAAFGGPALAQSRLRLAHFSPTTDPNHVTSEEFASRIADETGGAFNVQIFPASQLGGEVDAVEGVLLGTIDLTPPSAAVLANWVPELNVLNMPFAFRDWDHYTEVAQGELLDRLIEAAAEKNLRILGLMTSGVRHIMTREPLNSFEELQGRRIRAIQNPVHVATFNAFGANATAIAYPELYSSLQTGVVDGADAANTNYYTDRFLEVAPYWAQVSWLFFSNCLVMREDRFQAMSEDMRETFARVGREVGRAHFERYREIDENMLDRLVEAGVTVTQLDPAPFREAAREVHAQFITTDRERELLAMILAE